MICKHVLLITFLNRPKLILLHMVKWSQTVLFDLLIGLLSGATTSGQSGPGSDGNEVVLHIPCASPSNDLMSYPCQSWGVLLFCRDTVSVFYSPSQLSLTNFESIQCYN